MRDVTGAGPLLMNERYPDRVRIAYRTVISGYFAIDGIRPAGQYGGQVPVIVQARTDVPRSIRCTGINGKRKGAASFETAPCLGHC